MIARYDYLIVGAGLSGAVAARQLKDAGKRVLVLERNPAGVGGMARTETLHGQQYQLYGGHIFHTNDCRLWDYVNRYASFKPYWHRVKAMARGQVYSLPVNLETLQQVYGLLLTPTTAAKLLSQWKNGHSPRDAQDWLIQHVGPDIAALLFEGYTAKQWGRALHELPAEIVARLPVRLNWDDHYFSDTYQGLPVEGYTALCEALLQGSTVLQGENYCDRTTFWNEHAHRVIFTGAVDALMGYQLGRLAYRSMRFEHLELHGPDYQGCATLNHCDAADPVLREEEWQHWWKPATPRTDGVTLITRTWPDPGSQAQPLYPVVDNPNRELYAGYVRMVRQHYPQMRLLGRLAQFRYYDMHQAVAAALTAVEEELA